MFGGSFTTRLLMLAIAGLLPSCLDCREEYWLQADGSGRAKINYEFPAAMASAHGGESGIRNLVAGFLDQAPEVTPSTIEVTTTGKRTQVMLDINFDSASDLKNITNGNSLGALPSVVRPLAGDVTAEIHGRTLDFSRKITPSKALPGSAFLPASQFEGHRLHYIMHLPAIAADSNATRVENGGRTLVWDIPLAQAVKTPLMTRFTMKIPIPWKLASAIAIAISIAAGGFFLHRIRKSRTRFLVGAPQHPVL